LGPPGDWLHGLAVLDNPGLEQRATTEPRFGNGKATCTGLFSMATTCDNSHGDDKLLNNDDSFSYVRLKLFAPTPE